MRIEHLRTSAMWLCVALLTLLAQPALSKPKSDTKPIDAELEKYWNVELAVPTLTNPTYTHKGALEGTVAVGMVPNDSYYLPVVLSARGAYHMTETLSVEASLSYWGVAGNSELHDFLLNAGNEGFFKGVKKPPKMNLGFAADVMFRPFHGKLGIFDKKLSSFDLAFLAGVGVIAADIDTDPERETPLENQLFFAGHWGLTLRFFLSKWMTVRADYRHYTYKPYDAWLFPVEMTLGVSFLSN